MDTSTNLPVKSVYFGNLQGALHDLNDALFEQQQHHPDIIKFASTAIDEVLNSILPELLDIRAYSHSTQGKPNMVITDAQRMIEYWPGHIIGYLRKGSTLSMYGQHAQAIEAYNEGIQNTKTSSLYKHESLTLFRNMATHKLNQPGIDFLAMLPSITANKIIIHLPQEAKANCLMVSRVWRKLTLECASAWHNLQVDDYPNSYQLVNEAPHLGRHVRYITISTSAKRAHCKTIKMLMDGHFSKIESLSMTRFSTNDFKALIRPLLVAFWQMKTTLTSLEIHFDSNKHAVSLADILWSCTNLTDLYYSIAFELSSFGTATDDHWMLNKNHPLTNLELRSAFIRGDDINSLLQQCPKLRRLVMHNCDSTVRDSIYTYASASLEILGMNSHVPVPQLTKEKNNHEHSVPGLRNIYDNIKNYSTPVQKIVPLLYKHKDTLQTIKISGVVCPNGTSMSDINKQYPDFKLKQITSFSFLSTQYTQQLMLQIIHDATTLMNLHVRYVYDLDALVETVLKLPPLEDFQFEGTYDHTQRSRSVCLIKLFDKYAVHSKSQQAAALKSVGLRDRVEVNDDVLDSLASVTTLRKVDLGPLRYVTADGIVQFFAVLGDQLVYVGLSDMDVITDTIVAALET
ncbi:hypothetical protein BJV82DRAFT_672674 [Fennellomyces sp. T-0311]|nr:hypothetical protein BJV82DRAFT_672674 [Fennellomyces sp. T-0311]